jgi:GMP reductase|tara:strand:- start:2860 stop:4008 length:1149 start_codon:yes stop_codon:yes gene_type:complete
MRIENEVLLDYSDVLIRPKRSTLGSRKEVNLEREFTFRNYNKQDIMSGEYDWKGVPIMASNMDGVGTFEMADKLAEGNIFTCLVKTYSEQDLIKYFTSDLPERSDYVAMSIGIQDRDLNKFEKVYTVCKENLKYVCIDVANGYSQRFVEFVGEFKFRFPKVVIIAGNVVTADQTQELILNGADIVKVGIGPGSVCTTRIQTGVGYPQLSAVIECADAAHGLGGHIIADGGCTCPGDVAKAFAGGADFVMLGGMLAGHDEGGGDVITRYYETSELEYQVGEHLANRVHKVEEKQFIKFYGMSSDAANTKHFGGLKEYRSSEGREVLVPYRGEIARTVQNILGGVRSTCTYVGANTLKQLSKCTTFIRVNNQFNKTYESTTTKL